MVDICLLGATGSIGTQTLAIIATNSNYRLVSFSFHNNLNRAIEIIKEFRPLIVGCGNLEQVNFLSKKYPNTKFIQGLEGLIAVASCSGHNPIVINALVGSVGLIPTIKAIENKRRILLANKETLVIGGQIVMKLAKENNVAIIPIDSEHSAIYQILEGRNHSDIKRIILTASGGPFLDYPTNQLENVSLKDALNHPNWVMGNKITIDSATMMNKGFEVIEAHYLFNMPLEKISVLIHPQSIIHSLVEFNDYSMLAQIGPSDMKIPIQYALNYPNHLNCDIIKPLDFTNGLNFQLKLLNEEQFPNFVQAIKALKLGGYYPTILNASNEMAVQLFIDGKIRFNQIAQIVTNSLNNLDYRSYHEKELNVNLIMELDELVKKQIQNSFS